MKKIILIYLVHIGFTSLVFAQESLTDTIKEVQLKEVVVIGNAASKNQNENKPLGTIDSYLEKVNSVHMIKRGAYAWEPQLQGMTSERSVITIDGMRIYSACTDKMDPVISYLEIANLSEATIQSGQAGAENGATIAGNINLKRKKSGFINDGFKGALVSGFETVNEQKIEGVAAQYSTENFYSNIDFTLRSAENYKAGGNREVLYSQFSKYNVAAIMGYKINDKQNTEVSLIYDEAKNVGYPALPMDVSLARAFIGALQYQNTLTSNVFSNWETKVYYNDITHVMDDSKRPDVPIRMDMPGWSKTLGMYSKIDAAFKKHLFSFNISSHYNTSLAEMTMFPNNPNENDMFMLTWPDVATTYVGFFAKEEFKFKEHWTLFSTIGTALHSNTIRDDFGLQSLRIFYTEMEKSKTRFLKNFSTQITYKNNKWQHKTGIGYGERAPSVSEGYGFYLYNSFDGFDYIGNPFLKNEKSYEINLSTQFKTKNITTKIQTAYFHITDYIIGKPNFSFSPMTIGANGIKVYEQLPYASIFNADFSIQYKLFNSFTFKGKTIYRMGMDNNNNNLPLIQPFSYETALRYQKNMFFVEFLLEGAAKQTNFSPEFGENQTNAYTILNLSASQTLYLNQQRVVLKLGAENFLDTYYSTFADWNNIPRTGRNIFINLTYSL
ncbi:MAG: TonB-dependent receptor [Bacteroidetes bacterium HGW-Bacteroidetes-2]|jgi:iron complex outermembrane receptor protein|nr:MAG: TonB-dependent receptor [Bacteroidetes bacterium HGW-Bacteroidetes-2]